jgi:hypothetical protein
MTRAVYLVQRNIWFKVQKNWQRLQSKRSKPEALKKLILGSQPEVICDFRQKQKIGVEFDFEGIGGLSELFQC